LQHKLTSLTNNRAQLHSVLHFRFLRSYDVIRFDRFQAKGSAKLHNVTRRGAGTFVLLPSAKSHPANALTLNQGTR
jgi:hypothetical protein